MTKTMSMQWSDNNLATTNKYYLNETRIPGIAAPVMAVAAGSRRTALIVALEICALATDVLLFLVPTGITHSL